MNWHRTIIGIFGALLLTVGAIGCGGECAGTEICDGFQKFGVFPEEDCICVETECIDDGECGIDFACVDGVCIQS